MAVKAKLKFRGDMPWELERKLIQDLGFRVFSRAGREWIIVEKQKSNFKPEVLIDGELPEHIQTMLIQRCNHVINCFREPELHVKSIRIRLRNIGLTLPPLQRKFIAEWTDRNVVEDE